MIGPNGAANVYLSGEIFNGSHTELHESAISMCPTLLAAHNTRREKKATATYYYPCKTINNCENYCAGGYGLPNSIPNDPSKTTATNPQTNTKVCLSWTARCSTLISTCFVCCCLMFGARCPDANEAWLRFSRKEGGRSHHASHWAVHVTSTILCCEMVGACCRLLPG